MLNTLKKCSQFFELRPLLKTQLNPYLLKQNNQVFLLTGNEGLGKRSLAHFLASAFLLSCPSFDQLIKIIETEPFSKDFNLLVEYAHPDLIWLSKKEGESYLKIDEVRRKTERELFMAPQISQKKVWVIVLEDLSEQAQNTLLKSLEEAPDYAVFILISLGSQTILPTILSRAQEIRLPQLSPTALKTMLLGESSFQTQYLTDENFSFIYSLTQGNPALVLRFLEETVWLDLRQKYLNHLLQIKKTPFPYWLDEAYQLAQQFNKNPDWLYQIFSLFFFDLILGKTKVNFEQYRKYSKNKDFSKEIFSFSSTIDLNTQELYALQEKITEVFQRLKEKSNFEMALHYLLMFLYTFLTRSKH